MATGFFKGTKIVNIRSIEDMMALKNQSSTVSINPVSGAAPLSLVESFDSNSSEAKNTEVPDSDSNDTNKPKRRRRRVQP